MTSLDTWSQEVAQALAFRINVNVRDAKCRMPVQAKAQDVLSAGNPEGCKLGSYGLLLRSDLPSLSNRSGQEGFGLLGKGSLRPHSSKGLTCNLHQHVTSVHARHSVPDKIPKCSSSRRKRCGLSKAGWDVAANPGPSA